MKQRLIAYFILLPIILFVGFTDIDVYLKYLAIATIPLSIGLLIYLFIKTKNFYKINKVLFFAIFIFGLLAPCISYAQCTAGMDPDSMDNYQRIDYYHNAQKTMAEIGRIPEEERTDEQKKEYEECEKIMREKAERLGFPPACPTAKELHDDLVSSCWACDIANLFIEAADKVASNLHELDKKNGYSKSLLALGFFFWILIHVIKLIMSFGRGDIGAFFTNLFLKMLLVGGIFILISFPMKGLVDFFISPFFLLSSTMSQEMEKIASPEKIPETFASVTDVSSNDFQGMKKNVDSMLKNGVTCSYCENLNRNSDVRDERDNKISDLLGHNPRERIVSPLLRNSLLCTVCSIYNVTVQPTVTGQFLVCNAKRKQTNTLYGKKAIYSQWNAWLVGILILFTFFSISAIFSFYLIDTFFRIALVLVLLPFLIVAAAFDSTYAYMKKGLEVIIHAVFTYVIISLFMTLTVQIFYYILGKQSISIIQATYEDNYDKLTGLVNFGNQDNHIVLACFGIALIVFFMMKQLDYYITTISGIKLNNSSGFQSASTIVGMGTASAKAVSDIYSDKWKRPGNNSGNSPEDKAAEIRQWGEKSTDGKAEQAIDNATDNLAAKGENKANQMLQEARRVFKTGYGLGAIKAAGLTIGAGLVFAGAGVSAFALNKTGRFFVKIPKTPIMAAKLIARNKYFNKTVGFIWQAGENGVNGYRQTKKSIRNTKAFAKNKYRKIRQYLKKKGII